MSGRIISTPGPMRFHKCDVPTADAYQPGTVWQCDDCEKKWVVVTGSQYNESYTAWRRLTERTKDGRDQ